MARKTVSSHTRRGPDGHAVTVSTYTAGYKAGRPRRRDMSRGQLRSDAHRDFVRGASLVGTSALAVSALVFQVSMQAVAVAGSSMALLLALVLVWSAEHRKIAREKAHGKAPTRRTLRVFGHTLRWPHPMQDTRRRSVEARSRWVASHPVSARVLSLLAAPGRDAKGRASRRVRGGVETTISRWEAKVAVRQARNAERPFGRGSGYLIRDGHMQPWQHRARARPKANDGWYADDSELAPVAAPADTTTGWYSDDDDRDEAGPAPAEATG